MVGLLLGIVAAVVHGCAASKPPKAPQERLRSPRIRASAGVVVNRACSPSGPELCFNARDDNCNGVIDEGCGINTGLVQFAIAWEEAGADVDLHVTDPNGELIDVGRSFESGLVKEKDCPGRNNACHGQNTENVYLESGDPVRGRYRIGVRLERLGGENPPIRVTLGARVGPKTYQLELELERPEQEKELILEL